MNVTLTSICITVDPQIQLRNTAPSPPVALKGNYVAFPELGSDPRAYKLHKADAEWKTENTSIATVFIIIDQHGHAKIS